MGKGIVNQGVVGETSIAEKINATEKRKGRWDKSFYVFGGLFVSSVLGTFCPGPMAYDVIKMMIGNKSWPKPENFLLGCIAVLIISFSLAKLAEKKGKAMEAELKALREKQVTKNRAQLRIV